MSKILCVDGCGRPAAVGPSGRQRKRCDPCAEKELERQRRAGDKRPRPGYAARKRREVQA